MRRTAVLVLGLVVLTAPAAAEDEEAPEPKPLPTPRLVGPRVGEARTKALKRNGGNTATEKAVVAGLDWLARHQSEDGGWDADGFPDLCKGERAKCDGSGKGQHGEERPCPFDGPISALATMAFLGHGHVPGVQGDVHAKRVERALRHLESVGGTWGLPLATQALAEAEAMERKGRWRDAVARGAAALLARRGKDGAWGYAAGFRKGSDVPYTALVVTALVTARDAGVELPDELAEGVDRYLGSLELGTGRKAGRLAYLLNGRAYGYTPTLSNAHCAAAIRELLEVGTRGKRHRSHMALVSKRKPSWKFNLVDRKVPGRGTVQVQTGNLYMYNWWYGTLASFQAGGSTWSGWFGKAKGALVGNRRKSGCARGSWDPKGWYERRTGGRVFSTALGVLILEAPYRHRRLSDPPETLPGKKRKE